MRSRCPAARVRRAAHSRAALAVLALACGGGGEYPSAPGPTSDVVGHVYALQTVGGRPLPVPTDPAFDGSPLLLLADTLRFNIGLVPGTSQPRISVDQGLKLNFDPPRSTSPNGLDRNRGGDAVQDGDAVRLTFQYVGSSDPVTGAVGVAAGPTLTLRFTLRDRSTRPEPLVYQRVR